MNKKSAQIIDLFEGIKAQTEILIVIIIIIFRTELFDKKKIKSFFIYIKYIS